jgi:hypothetical protein
VSKIQISHSKSIRSWEGTRENSRSCASSDISIPRHSFVNFGQVWFHCHVVLPMVGTERNGTDRQIRRPWVGPWTTGDRWFSFRAQKSPFDGLGLARFESTKQSKGSMTFTHTFGLGFLISGVLETWTYRSLCTCTSVARRLDPWEFRQRGFSLLTAGTVEYWVVPCRVRTRCWP